MPPPPLSTAPSLPPAPPLRLAPPPPPVKKPRVFKVAHDITEPDIPVVEPVSVVEPIVATDVEPVIEPVVDAPVVDAPVEPVVEPVATAVEPVVPVPVDFDREVEMWRGIEIPAIVTKAEEKEYDDMPPLISVSELPLMPSLDDCIDDDMPPLEDHHNEADDEGEPPQVEEEEEEEEKPLEEDCQFLHDESHTIDGELESFSMRIYNALTDINNVLFTAFASVVIGFILVNTFDNRVLNNLNEL